MVHSRGRWQLRPRQPHFLRLPLAVPPGLRRLKSCRNYYVLKKLSCSLQNASKIPDVCATCLHAASFQRKPRDYTTLPLPWIHNDVFWHLQLQALGSVRLVRVDYLKPKLCKTQRGGQFARSASMRHENDADPYLHSEKNDMHCFIQKHGLCINTTLQIGN